MIAIGLAILLGAIMLLAFGLMKYSSDLKNDAIRSSKELFDEHFACADMFIKDTASPVGLSNILVWFSRTINNAEYGKFIVDTMSKRNFTNRSTADQRILAAKNELEQLRLYRPDLADAFAKAVVSGFIAAAYRQAAREMSPIRAIKESQQAKRAKRSRKPDELVPEALRAAHSFGLPNAA